MRAAERLGAWLAEAAPDATVAVDADGRIVACNARAERLFGSDPGQLVGRLVKELLTGIPVALEDPALQDPARHAGPVAARGRRLDGRGFPAEVSITALGREHLIIAAIRDVSDRPGGADAQLLAAIVQSSHDAIVSTDLSGRVVSWNPGAQELYGYAADEVQGRPIDLLIPADRRSDEREIRTLVAQGGRVDRHRTVRVRRDGSPVAVSVAVSPLLGADGKIIGATTMARDVSERERSEAHVQAVLDAAPDALLGVDAADRIVLVNSQAERLFDHPRYEMIDMMVHRLIPSGLPAGDPAGAAPDGQPVARRRDGSELPVEITVSSLTTEGGPITIAAVRDVRDRLAALAERERLQQEADRQRLEARLHRTQRLESLGQLAGGVAHDFNNLLAVILNYAGFIVEDAPNPEIATDAEQIVRAAKRGSDLTHQLLAFARREVVRPKPLNVNEVIGEVKRMLQRSLGEHISLSTDLPRGLPPVVADPSQLEQVLVNLAVNARDAMPTGGRLTVDTAVVEAGAEDGSGPGRPEPDRYVRIRVCDTGVGMPPEVVERAFEPFFTTKPSGEGTGLGLATVYGTITQAGGSVQIRSEPGVGTTVSILLPASEAAPAAPDEKPENVDCSGRWETVLVVEDEDALREVTSRMLHRGGYRVIPCASGTSALQIVNQDEVTIDLLLTDVIMPGMLGRQLAEHVAKVRPELPILYMSGYAQPVLASRGTLDADVTLLEKPFTKAVLLNTVRRALDRAS